MKRFLNVLYKGINARINVTDMEDLSEVQKEVKQHYDLRVGSAYINFFDKHNTQICDMDNITDEYFKKQKDGGSYLRIDLNQSTEPDISPSFSKFSSELKEIRGWIMYWVKNNHQY
jgi:hypothetical protein